MDATADAGARRADEGGRAETEEGALKRAISPRLLFFFILGDMLGGGIYALVGEVALEVGGALWLAFLLAFVLALLTAASYAELVTKYPRAAGAALYVHKAFGIQFLTFMVAFAVMASGITSASALARGFAGDYFKQFVDAPSTVIALLFVAAITIINLIGISESVKTNVAFTTIELVGLLVIVILGAAALFGGDAEPGRALEFKEGSSPLLLIVGGATLAFYALIGFEDSVNVAEEVKEPHRTFPPALFAAMLVAGTVYLLVATLSSMVVQTGRLGGSDAPLLEVVIAAPVEIPPRLFAGIALFALANGALINMIMASRLVYGMSNQGIVPGVFSSVLPARRTPWVAIGFTTALAVVLVLTGNLEILADTTVMLLLLVFVAVNVSVLALRRDRVDHPHFRAPTFAPVLGAIVSLALVAQNEAAIFVRAGVLLLIGVAFWTLNRIVHGGDVRPKTETPSG
jgi:APA family basic amino acid/polyamine antiporter